MKGATRRGGKPKAGLVFFTVSVCAFVAGRAPSPWSYPTKPRWIGCRRWIATGAPIS